LSGAPTVSMNYPGFVHRFSLSFTVPSLVRAWLRGQTAISDDPCSQSLQEHRRTGRGNQLILPSPAVRAFNS
jgi:hypothetical protein